MYSSVEWFRSHGVSEEDASDADLTAHIKEVSLFIDDFTGMWFEPRKKTYVLDGDGQEVLYVYIPIISIQNIKFGDEEISLENFTVYNQDFPDDRKNPRISRPLGEVFPKGKNNIELVGRFGYTILGDPILLPALVGTPVFTGSGIDDLTSSGTYTGEEDIEIVIIVDGIETVNTYKVSTDGGTTFTENVAMLAGPVEVIDGVLIEFEDDADHTIGDRWDFTATISQPNRITPYDITKICRMLVLTALHYPLEDAFKQMELDMNTRVQREATDKHSIEYRTVPLGNLQATGINIIDSVLFKYRELRPRYVGWV